MVVVVVVAAHPVVVVAHAVEGFDGVAPRGLEAHARTGRVQVRLEREDLRVLGQHRIGVELLARVHALDVDVHAVAEADVRGAVVGLVALGHELEADFEVRLGVAAVRMQVDRVGHDRRPRLEQPRGLRVEEVGFAAHFMDRPGGGAGGHAEEGGQAERLVGIDGFLGRVEDAGVPDHVVEHVAAAHRFAARSGRIHVVHFAHFERGHVAVLGQSGRRRRNLAPPVGRIALHQDVGGLHHQVGLTNRPAGAVVPHARGRQVGRVAAGRTGIGPLGDQRDFFVAERRIVLEVLNPDFLLDVPRRHYARARADAGAGLDRARPRTGLFVGLQRHRRHAARAVAVLAAALQDRRDVLGEGHFAGRCRRLLGLGRNGRQQDHGGGQRGCGIPRVGTATGHSCAP